MEQRSHQQYVDQLRELATSSFADHVIKRSRVSVGLPDPNRWLVARERDGFYWTEVVILDGGALFAHGDIEEVYWRGGGGGWRERIEWIAEANWQYAWEKARKPSMYDSEVCLYDLRQLLKESKEDGCDQGDLDVVTECIELLKIGDPPELVLQHGYNSASWDWEAWEHCGRVPQPRFFYAWEAVRTLHRLLNAMTEEERARHEIERQKREGGASWG